MQHLEFSPPPTAAVWTLVFYGSYSPKETKWHQFRTEDSSKETTLKPVFVTKSWVLVAEFQH